MRCPKCGFHSFDYLDNCKKCGGDLTELKLRCKFQGYVAPAVETFPEPEGPSCELPEVAEAEEEAIDFGFDILEAESTPLQPAFASDSGEQPGDIAELGADDPSTIDLAADSGLNFDQPFASDSEVLPDDELPKLDDRF
ncbi:MAG: hypothetical protein NDI73_10850 [Desulfuromonadales bacterium]|nr:hypothetical protein [Desulfuromonadales bacterium]